MLKSAWQYRYQILLVWMFVAFVLVAFGFALWASYPPQAGVDPNAWWRVTISAIAVNALTSFGAVLFGLNRLEDHIERELQKSDFLRNFGLLVDFWGRESLRSNGFCIIYGGKLGAFRDDEHQHSSLATIYSLQALKEMFGKIFDKQFAPVDKAFDRVNAKEEAAAPYNIILLGGYVSIPVLEEFPKRAKLPYRQDFSDPDRRLIRVVDEERVSVLDEHTNHIVEDYALVTIAVESSGRHLFWFSGNYGIGTYGALLAATRNNPRLQMGKPEPGHYYQAVIRVWSVKESTLDPEHKEIEIYDYVTSKLPKDFSIGWLWPYI